MIEDFERQNTLPALEPMTFRLEPGIQDYYFNFGKKTLIDLNITETRQHFSEWVNKKKRFES